MNTNRGICRVYKVYVDNLYKAGAQKLVWSCGGKGHGCGGDRFRGQNQGAPNYIFSLDLGHFISQNVEWRNQIN